MLGDDLEYFLAIASTRTITSTAERLGISQPALTKSVQRLERKVGVKLVTRTSRGAELTDAGRAFCERLQAVARGLEDAVQEARDVGGSQAGLLRIGVTPATSDFTLESLMPTLMVERPVAHLKFTTALGGPLIDALSRREIELAVCPVPERLDPSLECEPLYAELCWLMMNDKHPLAAKKDIKVTDLVGHAWAGTGKNEFTRSQVEQAFAQHGLALPPMSVEADTLSALATIVSRTKLISMTNIRSTRPGFLPKNVVVRPVSLGGVQRRIGVIRRAGYLSPIALRAQEILRSAG
ncbi:LysR family transcriptional regulator [Undibacterium sp.]|uniref:LysR family transcriptional regulator n=1 Tax=Undibacterium sp. TaxID=1914977 RepID=UPI002BE32D63|nr:LysR family transcriptional regulator [Undibacterium sp.]HTD04063.1 LysR family transcriptional regulator [Undibacterium sp.]